jgi:DNA repair ATPase RecN
VDKVTREGRSVARIAAVQGTERIEEIARMAGGDAPGKATLRYARELLEQRGPGPPSP